MADSVYERLGARFGINARGTYTDLGGASISPAVWEAMAQANRHFAEMPDLLARAGERIADLMGCEATRITPGASAAIALSIAACMAGEDGAAMERLPDTTGLKNRVLIQRAHRYRYDRMVRMTGAELVEVGTEAETTPDELASAIDDRSAAVLFPAHLDGLEGTVPLEKAVSIAHGEDVPTVVDAAYLIYPTKLMRSFSSLGADGVIFSSKYMGGPNAGGFICGSAALIDAVAAVDFTDFESGEYLIFGRPFKLDRWTVAGVLGALEEWLEMDHDARFEGYLRKVEAIAKAIPDGALVEAAPMHFTMEEELIVDRPNCLVVKVDPGAGFTARDVHQGLRDGRPAVFCHLRGDALILDVEAVRDEDAEVIGRRLREELSR